MTREKDDLFVNKQTLDLSKVGKLVIKMGLFGSSSSDTSGDYSASKLRTPSYSSELDLSSDGGSSSLGATSSLDLAGGDLQAGLQIEQQKATLMSQVLSFSYSLGFFQS